uniref:TIL domain-containing protein n=1 Tax=Anopheles coluzzii TaxID=1518534 RepID=A0A8W7Q2X1_ANOCL
MMQYSAQSAYPRLSLLTPAGQRKGVQCESRLPFDVQTDAFHALHTTPETKCGVNQVAACCEPCYSVYCFYINRNCGRNCVKGCYCKLGFVQMQPNGPCVNKLYCGRGRK